MHVVALCLMAAAVTAEMAGGVASGGRIGGSGAAVTNVKSPDVAAFPAKSFDLTR